MPNATVLSGPSLIYQYIALKWNGLNLFITSLNTSLILLILSVIVACVRWCKIRSWRKLKMYSYINILISLTMYNALKTFLEYHGPVPKNFLNGFLIRLPVSSFTTWFMIMSWSSFANHLYPVFWSCLVASVLGWTSAVGYSALYADFGEDLFPLTVVAVGLSYVLHFLNVHVILKILMKKKEYICEVIKMLLYSSGAFIILIFLHVGEYVPEKSYNMWRCVNTVQIVAFLVYLCTGELCKLYHILSDKDNTEHYTESFEFHIIYHKRYICPVLICFYDVEVNGQPKISKAGRLQFFQDSKPKASKAGLEPYQDGKPKASKAELVPYQNGILKSSKPGLEPYQNGKPKAPKAELVPYQNGILKASKAGLEPYKNGILKAPKAGLVPYQNGITKAPKAGVVTYQDDILKASNTGLVPYQNGITKAPKAGLVTYQDGKPKASKPRLVPYQNGKPKPSIATLLPYYQDGISNASDATLEPYYQDGTPHALDATLVPYYDQDDNSNASNATVVPYYDKDGKPSKASNATPKM